jgi:hypothetical protein
MTRDHLSAFLRKAVNKALAPWDEPKLTNSEAAFLQDDQPDAANSDAYDLAEQIRQQRRARTPIGATDADAQDPEVARFMWAKSMLVAIDAASDPAVTAFRGDVLNDQLLALEQVTDWIDERTKSDGMPTRYVTGTPTVNVAADTSLPANVEIVAHGFFFESVEFTGDDGRVHRRPVARGGVLDHLRQLAIQLAANYPWQPAQASSFVLTGATPLVTALHRTMPGLGADDRRLITFEVDPDVPVKFVADAYTKARRELLGPRARPPTPSGIDLVIHGAERHGHSNHRMWTEWNDLHPKRTYPDLRAFRQAWKSAQRRTRGTPRQHP